LTLSVLRASEHGFSDGDHLIMDGHEYSAEQVYDALHGLHTHETSAPPDEEERAAQYGIWAAKELQRSERSYETCPPRELLERVAFEHRDSSKFTLARQELDLWLRSNPERGPALETVVRNAPLSKDAIRGILMSRGFKIPDGCGDLKPYVYEAVNEVLKAHGIAVTVQPAPDPVNASTSCSYPESK